MATKVLNGLDLSSQKIVNLASPSANTDAANKSYVDARVAGAVWKESVRAASTAAMTLSAVDAGSTLDGVILVEGDRVLLKNQTAGAENGIWVVNADTVAPTRATDADETSELANATVFVREGDTLDDTAWVQTADVTTVGTTAQTWVQFGAGGTTFTFGDGLIETAGDVDIELGASSGLSLAGGTLQVASTIAGDALSLTAGVLDVEPGTGLEIATDTIRIATTAAGNGLTGGGGSALAVGAGTGISVTADAVAIDTSVVARKASGAIGDGVSTSIAFTHSLGTDDVTVEVFDASTKATVLCDVSRNTINQVTLAFAVAPGSGAYRVVVVG